MDLASRIDSRLWAAIERAYDARDYTAAILDAMHFLGQLIRDRSGLESDGQVLVGAALGGNSPVLKINQLQTDSDWNVQRGIEQLLRGLYQAIRNPRSHQKHTDEPETAESLILFINYLVRSIDQARSPFELAAFLTRVFDSQFPENDRYAELLVAEIPPGQRYNVVVQTYRDRESGRADKLKYFFVALLKTLTIEEIDRFCDLLSEELKTTVNEASIRSMRQIVPNEYWPKLAEIARLRIESMFIASVREGRYDSANKRCSGGAFGTWASGIERFFLLQDELEGALASKLMSENKAERSYVLEYFFRRLTIWREAEAWLIGAAIHDRIEAGDEAVWNAMKFITAKSTPAWWKEQFTEALGKFVPSVEEPASEYVADEDVPF